MRISQHIPRVSQQTWQAKVIGDKLRCEMRCACDDDDDKVALYGSQDSCHLLDKQLANKLPAPK